jgi:TalC/MipB family fructose-6-phosphate aldolase
MYEFLLDTADLSDLTRYLTEWPVVGVTTNPSILKKEGKIDVYSRLAKIRELCGAERSLHVQVVSDTAEAIVEEAHCILDRLGRDVYIKIPVSIAGLPAIKQLAVEGVNVTATAIYSTLQGILAVLAGAKYIAVYYNRMENNCTDPNAVIREIRSFIDGSGSTAKILAASFRNVGQLTAAFANGAQSVTVGVNIIKAGLGAASIGNAVEGFAKDFESIHGVGQTMRTIMG